MTCRWWNIRLPEPLLCRRLCGDIILMMPFYFMFVSSLKPGTEILRLGLSFKIDPEVSTLKNYLALNTYREGIYWKWYLSSATIMVLQTAVGLFFGSIVGYGIAMYNFKGKNIFVIAVLVLMMVPFEMLIITNYQTIVKWQMVDSLIALIIPFTSSIFYTYILRNFFLSIPGFRMG